MFTDLSAGQAVPNFPTGWEAAPATSVSFTVPDNWTAGRIWGRRDCNFTISTGPTCLTGWCNGGLLCDPNTGTGVPPATVAEWTLQGNGNQDFYDVSLVDGYDLPIAITNNVNCPVASCPVDLGPICPQPIQGPFDSTGFPVGCESACFANLDGDPTNSANCCTGSHSTNATCPPSGVEFYSFFKGNCPDAYAYAFDESSGTALWTCDSGLNADYTLTFCPTNTTNVTVTSSSSSSATPTMLSLSGSVTPGLSTSAVSGPSGSSTSSSAPASSSSSSAGTSIRLHAPDLIAASLCADQRTYKHSVPQTDYIIHLIYLAGKASLTTFCFIPRRESNLEPRIGLFLPRLTATIERVTAPALFYGAFPKLRKVIRLCATDTEAAVSIPIEWRIINWVCLSRPLSSFEHLCTMTATVERPPIPHYTPAPATKEDLEYADLTILDLSKAGTPEGLSELAKEARDALHDQGFLYVVNHGLPAEEAARMFDIADVSFSQVSDEEKRKYGTNMLDTGSFQGYKLRQYWHIDGGVMDQNESFAINRNVSKQDHPQALQPLLPEIREFAQFNHFRVLHVILRLLAIGMELPEDTFVKLHQYDAVGESFVRFMKYHPRSEEEESKTNSVWLKGHTDIGSITILWSQPVGGLQILSKDGKWRWIRHIDNALVINTGDSMEFLSGGYYRGTIHRVIQPPADQRGYPRVGAYYFAFPDDNVRLVPPLDSPVLQKLGIKRRFADSEAPTSAEWRKAVTSAYGKTILTKGKDERIEEEYINGVLVKHYN
ncbi:hypothetical protein NM688_g4242 [Phlebia brevispora]|uniref:Uncharacterized protein n=1 Tax=Phlebia brevispora TaxID=194682 RepID=A0ACC1T3V2_9APHY|nr:hypothetical protein NM688_g4242 [Phlebia brevispora]